MKYRFEVVVMLKEGLLDPQGKALEDVIRALGFSNVSDVRVGKSVQLTVEAEDEADRRDVISGVLEEVLHPLAEKILSNPVIERFSVRPLGGSGGSSSPGEEEALSGRASGPPGTGGGSGGVARPERGGGGTGERADSPAPEGGSGGSSSPGEEEALSRRASGPPGTEMSEEPT